MYSWINLQKTIPDIRGSHIHVINNIVINQLIDQLLELEFEIYRVNGEKIYDEKTFFSEIGSILKFPPYFGENWGAWYDSLEDFIYTAPIRVAIVWENANRTFISDAQTFLQFICDINNLAESVALKRFSQNRRETKQIEVFILL